MPPRIPLTRLLGGLNAFSVPTGASPRFLTTTAPRLQQSSNGNNNSNNNNDPPQQSPWAGKGTSQSINQVLIQTINTFTQTSPGGGGSPNTTASTSTTPSSRGRNRDNIGGIQAPNGDLQQQAGTSELETEELFRLQRKFAQGDMYTPKDLSYESFKSFRRRKPPSTDSFDLLGIDPLLEYKNFSVLSEFVTEMGRIKHRNDTGLRGVNQRKIAKAIRRAVGIGLLPSTHKHPEILKRMEQSVYNRNRFWGGRR